jgi:hypothetical protein
MTKVMLCGMTERQRAIDLLPLARSWLQAPAAQCDDARWHLQGYDQTERAYLVRFAGNGVPRSLILNFDANEVSPLVNPVFIVKGWGDRPATLKFDGSEVPPGRTCRCGYRRSLSSTDLVVWLEMKSVVPCRIELSSRI